MKRSFEYATEYRPAFPVLDMLVICGEPKQSRQVRGLIDSGSDATQLPLALLRALGARQTDRRYVRDLAGVRYAVPIFVVSLQIGTASLSAVEVVGREGTDEVIVGRDVLNQFIVTLNGLANVTEISD